VWFRFLPESPASQFFFQGNLTVKQFAALVLDTALLTGLLVGVWLLTSRLRRSRRGELAADVGFLVFLTVPGNALRVVLQPVTAKLNLEYWRHAMVRGLPLGLKVSMWLGLLAAVWAVLCFHRHLTRFIYRTLVLLFPVVPFMIAEASWSLARHQPDGSQYGQPGVVLNQAARPKRVVWVIFDEMDYRLAFEGNTSLPEFQRLAAHSLFATYAYPPGGRTMISIPALLAGRFVTAVRAVDRTGYLVRYEKADGPAAWSSGQTVFDVRRQYGWRVGVAGWHFPYARVFGDETDAWEDQAWRLSLNPNRPFARLMVDQFRVLAEGRTRSLLGKSLSVMEHQRVVREVTAEATRKAADADLDLVFLHLPVPHAPFFYDSRTGGETSPLRPVKGYLDHLALADQVLAGIRQAIEQAGLENRTTLVISSDHWNRESDLIDGRIDHRVPFLVNFPGEARGIRYARPFNTVLSRNLVTAIMRGEVTNAAAVAAWIGHQEGGIAESPYDSN
jgi:hypothetical protein